MTISKPILSFVHIPKTGGSYLKYQSVITPLNYLGHCWFADTSSDVPTDKYPLYGKPDIRPRVSTMLVDANLTVPFTIVRDPRDFLVSYYCHNRRTESKKGKQIPFEQELAEKGFPTFVRAIINRERPWPSKQFLWWPMFSYEGRCMIKYVLFTEYLDGGLSVLAKKLKLSYRQRKRQNVSPERHPDWRHYYTPDLLEEVNLTYCRELTMFGMDDKPVALYEINTLPTYDWETDILIWR